MPKEPEANPLVVILTMRTCFQTLIAVLIFAGLTGCTTATEKSSPDSGSPGPVPAVDGGLAASDAGNIALPGGDPALEQILKDEFAHVYRIGGFYIAGTDERPRETDRRDRSGEEVVLQAVKLFSSLLDPDEDGRVDNRELLDNLGRHFVFASGAHRSLEPLEESIDRRTGRYVMSMKTDIWPFFPDYEGQGIRLEALTTSLWRPEAMNAVWEECFHTVTEAYNRHREDWSFGREGLLGRAMQADIDAGAYDISEQNRLEGGHYDWNTAVNEYVHQIWLVNQGGAAHVLTGPQTQVLDHMKASPGFPMAVNKDYPRNLAQRIK